MVVVQGHTNQGHNWKIGIKSFQHGNGVWIGVRRVVRWRIGRDGKGNVGRWVGGVEDWARWVSTMREREKKMRRKEEERREAGEREREREREREKKKERENIFLMEDEREI